MDEARANPLSVQRNIILGLLLALAAAAWGGCLAYLLLNAVVQVTSFPLIAVSSFAPAYPLLLVFIAAAFWDAWTAWRPETVAPSSNRIETT